LHLGDVHKPVAVDDPGLLQVVEQLRALSVIGLRTLERLRSLRPSRALNAVDNVALNLAIETSIGCVLGCAIENVLVERARTNVGEFSIRLPQRHDASAGTAATHGDRRQPNGVFAIDTAAANSALWP